MVWLFARQLGPSEPDSCVVLDIRFLGSFKYPSGSNELTGILKDKLIFALIEDDTDKTAAMI